MKYIRTKDGIYDTTKGLYTPSIKMFAIGTKTIYDNDIIKQSNTIEELCDGFYVQIDDWSFDTTHLFDNLEKAIEDFEDWQSYSDRKGLEYEIEVYAFIKTSKGLIYVAKMNEKGDWELI